MDKEDLNLNELLEDIRKIKSSIKQNSYTYQQLVYSPVVKLILWVSGVAALFIPVFYYFLLERYVNYVAIPYEFRLALLLAIIIGCSLAVYGKLILILKAYQLTPQPSLLKFLNRLFSRQVLLLIPLVIVSIFFFVYLFMLEQNYNLIVPAVAIGLGICFSIIGSFVSSSEFFYLGNYCWILGTVSIPFVVSNPGAALPWISGIFGVGLLGLGFYLTFLHRAPTENEVGKMMGNNDSHLNELLEDIRKIKNAIKQNSYTFKQIFDYPFFKLTLLFIGLMGFFIPIFYYLLLKNNQNYEAIPFEIRLALILAVIIGFSLIAIAKVSFYYEARQQRPRASWIELFSRLISRQVLLIYPALVGGLIFFIIYFLAGRMYHLLVPTMAIGMGVCFSIIGAFISLPEFFVFGSFFWILGMVSVPFISKAPSTALLWVSGTFGLGMLAFSFYLMFWRRESKEHENETA